MVSVGLCIQGQESNSVPPAHQLDPLVVLITLAEPGSLGSQSSWPVQGLTLLLLEPLLQRSLGYLQHRYRLPRWAQRWERLLELRGGGV